MVYRIFVEKKEAYANEKNALLADIRGFLKISSVRDLRLFNCYDVENISEALFEACKTTVFSEPQMDVVYDELPVRGDKEIAYEYLPGQFDQRADSAAQCIQLISQRERPIVRTSRVLELFGSLTAQEAEVITKYVINPVEARQTAVQKPETLQTDYSVPETVEVLDGFCKLDGSALDAFIAKHGLAMDTDDVCCCIDYFRSIGRDPTITEIKILDTYWSDHCRHTTFLTNLEHISIAEQDAAETYDAYLKIREELGVKKPVCLMDLATIGAKYLKKQGLLEKLDASEEINACTVKIDVATDSGTEKWLLLFKNETHNHPTEIEPFGGAATCIGGAIRDPLSGRSYVYQAMRITGGANPLRPVEETLLGKLPQRKLLTTAANGYSSYGNQIGLATGLVDEIYHDGYAAKHMELGMVVAAAPAENVVREVPAPGDVVVLLGGRTGRDGCGGATGSSKSHTLDSLETCGAEVQKGNAPEERKLQRLFRNKAATTLIKRCNDFGAGGVSVAIGELADGLSINLNAVPKKYDGLDGTELAISESQERMAVVIAPENVSAFIALAQEENLEATVVAEVTAEPKMVMRWNGNVIASIDRSFLNSNGAPKRAGAAVVAAVPFAKTETRSFKQAAEDMVRDLNICSKQGLSERFDSTIGTGTVLMPFGGTYQRTPIQAMVGKIPVLHGETTTCSVSAYGYNPFITEKSPYHGAYLAVVESVSKIAAAGGNVDECYLTFQEYFERLGSDPKLWGKPLAAMLGALQAQLDLELASIGGKDSMSGTFEDLSVPPTLISFAVATGNTADIVSPEFKRPESTVVLLAPQYKANGLPDPASLKDTYRQAAELIRSGKVLSAYTPAYGGVLEGLLKMTMGNRIGFVIDGAVSMAELTAYAYGSFILELAESCDIGIVLGQTTEDYAISYQSEKIDLLKLEQTYEEVLEPVYPLHVNRACETVEKISFRGAAIPRSPAHFAQPKVVIPVFPGTNCEYDTAAAFEKAGAVPQIEVIRNLTSAGVAQSVQRVSEAIDGAQIIFIPGGFSGGDEPDGSGKFITAFFRNPAMRESVSALLRRGGLIGGICNGFQALIKLGLVPFGKIVDTDESSPTLTFNTIGRHQSMLVRTRVCSVQSPWLQYCAVDDIHLTPVSHGEGRFICTDDMLRQLTANGQVATQYVDLNGQPTMDIRYNTNGSVAAIEGITSPDGRVFGKMAHSERCGADLYKNVNGNKDNQMFRGAVDYFKL